MNLDHQEQTETCIIGIDLLYHRSFYFNKTTTPHFHHIQDLTPHHENSFCCKVNKSIKV